MVWQIFPLSLIGWHMKKWSHFVGAPGRALVHFFSPFPLQVKRADVIGAKADGAIKRQKRDRKSKPESKSSLKDIFFLTNNLHKYVCGVAVAEIVMTQPERQSACISVLDLVT